MGGACPELETLSVPTKSIQNHFPHDHPHNEKGGDLKKSVAFYADRIGRRKEDAEGKTIWISQRELEEQERQTEPSNAQQSRFAFCLDDSNEKAKIRITSPELVNAIKETMPLSFFESMPDSVSFQAPYAHLFHYSKDIHQELGLRCGSTSKALGDFFALESFLDTQSGYGMVWKSLDAGNQTVVSFENLWALFRVSDLLVVQDRLEERRLFRFTRTEESFEERVRGQRFCAAIDVHFWHIDWSPDEKRFRQKSQSAKLPRFGGLRDVSTLPIYPLRYESEDTVRDLIVDLQSRGKKWSTLVSDPPRCYDYHGRALQEEENMGRGKSHMMHVNGRVILDQKDRMNIDAVMSGIEFERSSSEVDEKLNDSWNISQHLKLTDPAHFLLCPAQISCYHIETGKRYLVNVNNLQQASWSESAMDQLVLDEEKKDFLKALVDNVNTLHSRSGDIIANKGRGLTILLHGPPGVGKTLSAECIAEYARMPLIPLSVGNLVAVEDSIEQELTEAFANAERLGAILLLDEADVVLEARSFEDVRRNGIVSVFLRQLEYYSGILFLTTNRINSMDAAFQSRIQVAIEYSELTKNQRQDIWASLLNSNLIDCADKDKAIIEGHIEELAQSRLNGRQIRNTLKLSAFKAAADMASDRKVQLKHIKKALMDTVKFQECFEEGKKDMKNKNTVWKPFAPTQSRGFA